MITLGHLHIIGEESCVKYNSLKLVVGIVGRLKKLGVVIRRYGRDLGVVRAKLF